MNLKRQIQQLFELPNNRPTPTPKPPRRRTCVTFRSDEKLILGELQHISKLLEYLIENNN